jgi:hypothetical protein
MAISIVRRIIGRPETDMYSKPSATTADGREAVLRATAARLRRGALGRRASWGFFDQTLSSLTNFGLSIFVAATVSADQFGTFALIFGAYSALIGVSAGLTSVPLTVRFSAAVGDRLAHAERASLGAALGLGVLSSIGFLGAAAIVGGRAAPSLVAMAVVLPGLLTQDTWRYVFMTRGRPSLAAANDGCWALLQIFGLLTLVLLGQETVPSLVLVWGGSATAAAAVGAWQAGAWPAIQRGPGWLKTQWDLAARYAIEMSAIRVGPFLVLAGVGAVAGVRAVGALRGAQLVVMTLPNLLFTGVGFVAVPEGVRLIESDPLKLPRVIRAVTVGATVAALFWCAVAIGGSSVVGGRVLGDTWPLARPLLGITAFAVLGSALALGPSLGLWILADARRSVRLRVVSSLLAFSAVPAAVGDGAQGAALAVAGAAILSAALWWWQFLRRQRTAPGRVADQRHSLALSGKVAS